MGPGHRRAFGLRLRLRLRELRAKADRTQASIAAEAGVDRAFYVNVGNGTNSISLDEIFVLADALGVDAAELFRGLHS
ncbi:helix-turn-helix transcriptional regulator [Streptomyces xinghaiensis]|uniref:XRE family transcriptional regulator n=1 Tax=Streptomyces xinghaiensis TaxID=1038928 RepID=A0A3M8EYM7_9ACTN|nr:MULTISPECIES: helix-turn-helix transcriptional regulator [Streptomyces]PQM20613.1 XRE family transcriptional regulator [Streptomyces xinghaiensis]RKM92555.1 XRE family transcriptional regulator [Streptomyces xinghaiensis]RNC70522.1 XRE family transcriptional regulator [Streptomyces xinghaiensis]